MKRDFDLTWNPVMPLVDAMRRVLPPAAGRWVHWGATSKNIMDTGTALQIRDSYAVVLAELDAICDVLARLARRHRDTVMAGRTHGQHALPVTFGFKVAAWLDELLRQRERLLESRRRVLVGEFGGAIGTLASLGRKGLQVQKRLMTRLGLGVPAIPAKTAGDRFAEFFLLLAMLSATLGKIAQNIYNLQVTELDEVTEFVEGKVGSSAMPHKLNPVASGSVVLLGRLLRARAGPVLDYIHSEWEDDHRQGETAWSFGPEVCLLMGAQLDARPAAARHPGRQAREHAAQPGPQRRRGPVRGGDDGAGPAHRARPRARAGAGDRARGLAGRRRRSARRCAPTRTCAGS